MFVLPRRHYKTEGFRLILRAWLSEFVLKIVAICTHVSYINFYEIGTIKTESGKVVC